MAPSAPKADASDDVTETGTYTANKYTCLLGTVAKVTYENGTSFILNYNSFQITVDGVVVDALGYAIIK